MNTANAPSGSCIVVECTRMLVVGTRYVLHAKNDSRRTTRLMGRMHEEGFSAAGRLANSRLRTAAVYGKIPMGCNHFLRRLNMRFTLRNLHQDRLVHFSGGFAGNA